MGRNYLHLKIKLSLRRHITFLLFSLFLFIAIQDTPSCFADASENIDTNNEITAGGKRSKAQIAQYIKRLKEKKRKGVDEDPLAKWKTQGKSEKFFVQKKFASVIHETRKMVENLQKSEFDSTSDIEALLDLRQAIIDADKALQIEFSDVKKKCTDQGLPSIILERHEKMLQEHNHRVKELLDELDALDTFSKSRSRGEATQTLDALRLKLDDFQVIKDPPLLQANLPRGTMNIEADRVDLDETSTLVMDPKDLGEEQKISFQSLDNATILAATSVDSAGATAMSVTGSPAAEDLEETIDVRITPEIIELAAGLDNSPYKIYRYVKDNFDFDPYLGSRKGSRETLNQMSGNDYDLASLLIALLRASDIPARYVRGTVELSVDQAKNWLGVNDGATAGSILATAGMDGVNYYLNDELTSIRCRRVWVEAYIPYTNYRGKDKDGTGKMWVPMDPATKEYEYQEGVDIPLEMGFDAETFMADYISTYHELSPVERYMQQINDYLEINYPEYTYGDIIRTREILPESIGFIPGALPFNVISLDSDFAQIPDDQRYKMRFHLYSGGTTLIDHTVNLPDIAGKRVTISYIPATTADEDTIKAYGGLYDTPPYLVRLKPVLKIDGEDAAVSSASVMMGITHNSDMHFTPPTGQNNVTPVVSNTIIAGTYQAVGIDTGKINPDIFMPEAEESTPSIDDITGGKLWKTAMGYLDRIERNDEEVSRTMQVVITKDVSEAIVENTILVTYSGSTPQTFEWRGMVVDADRCTVGTFPVDGNENEKKAFMVLSGADGSVSENRIFEDTFDEEAVSTIKILELAGDLGIPIYTFNSSNIGSIYSSLNLSSSVESAIYSAVAGGKEVTVPRDNITYLEWYGTGYIDMDPDTGAAGYIISGGHSGGATVDIWVSWKMTWGVIAGEIFHNIDYITANITFPPAGAYFPRLTWWDFLTDNKLHFDVTYTIHYDDGGSSTIYENYSPHYPYPAADYTFYAGWDTGEALDYTIFGVEIETPDGEDAVAGCDPITLETKFTPSAPSSPTYQWSKSWSLACLFGSGDGTFTPDTAISTEFAGTTAGGIAAQVTVSNTYGTTKATKCLTVIGVEKIKAEDSDDSSNTIEDADEAVESDIQTLYVARSDTGTVNISVEPSPSSITESQLPTDWKIEKVSGTLAFDGTVGKLSAKVKKDTTGDIVVKITPCSSSSDHFQVKIVVISVTFSRAGTEGSSGNKYGYDEMESDPDDDHVSLKKNDLTFVNVRLDGVLDATDIKFVSEDETIVKTEVPSATPAAGFLLKLFGQNQDKAETKVNARLGSETGPIAAVINVNVYKEIVLAGDYYSVYKTGDNTTKPSAVSETQIESVANDLLKFSVVKISITAPVEKAIEFDKNGNGRVDFYKNGSNPETEKIYEELNNDGAVFSDIVLLKDLFFRNWYISSSTSIGDTTIDVPATDGLLTGTGQSYSIKKPDGTDKETFYIVSISGNTLTIDTDTSTSGNQGLTKAHPLTADPKTSHTIVDELYETAGLSSNRDTQRPALVVGATASGVGHLAAHEQMHGQGLSDVNCSGNVMHYTVNSIGSLPFRYKELVQVVTGTSNPKSGSPTDNQWNDPAR